MSKLPRLFTVIDVSYEKSLFISCKTRSQLSQMLYEVLELEFGSGSFPAELPVIMVERLWKGFSVSIKGLSFLVVPGHQNVATIEVAA